MIDDRLQFIAGIVLGCIGLVMLVHVDVPVIRHGGVSGVLAVLELSLALLVLTAAVTLHSREM